MQVFEPIRRRHPESLSLTLAVGLALVRDSRSVEGIEVLRAAVLCHPHSAEAWDGWLTGLDEGYRPDLLAQEYARLPGSLAARGGSGLIQAILNSASGATWVSSLKGL